MVFLWRFDTTIRAASCELRDGTVSGGVETRGGIARVFRVDSSLPVKREDERCDGWLRRTRSSVRCEWFDAVRCVPGRSRGAWKSWTRRSPRRAHRVRRW